MLSCYHNKFRTLNHVLLAVSMCYETKWFEKYAIIDAEYDRETIEI